MRTPFSALTNSETTNSACLIPCTCLYRYEIGTQPCCRLKGAICSGRIRTHTSFRSRCRGGKPSCSANGPWYLPRIILTCQACLANMCPTRSLGICTVSQVQPMTSVQMQALTQGNVQATLHKHTHNDSTVASCAPPHDTSLTNLAKLSSQSHHCCWPINIAWLCSVPPTEDILMRGFPMPRMHLSFALHKACRLHVPAS